MSDDKKKRPGLDAAYGVSAPEDHRTLYRDWAASYDSGFAAASGYRSPRRVAEAYLAAGGVWPALDVGCGTGLVAERLPAEAVIDGCDISAEMLSRAAEKGRYRALFEADVTQPLAVADGAYAGMLSAGTFTIGHLGPEPLLEIFRVLRPESVLALSGNRAHFEAAGFFDAFARWAAEGAISSPDVVEEPIYDRPPEGHEADLAAIATFRRL